MHTRTFPLTYPRTCVRTFCACDTNFHVCKHSLANTLMPSVHPSVCPLSLHPFPCATTASYLLHTHLPVLSVRPYRLATKLFPLNIRNSDIRNTNPTSESSHPPTHSGPSNHHPPPLPPSLPPPPPPSRLPFPLMHARNRGLLSLSSPWQNKGR